jgi:hypothetical protein
MNRLFDAIVPLPRRGAIFGTVRHFIGFLRG